MNVENGIEGMWKEELENFMEFTSNKMIRKKTPYLNYLRIKKSS